MNAEQLLKQGNSLVTVTVGSRLFGTDRPTSDLDLITVYKPHLENLILKKDDSTAQTKGEVYVGAGVKVACEHTHWSLQHFMNLLAQGQTQALEIMFAPPNMWTSGDIKRDHIAQYWHDFRKEFHANTTKWLSKNTAAFVGYCRSQANKYSVKGERLEAAKAMLDYFKSLPEDYNCTLNHKFCDISPSVVGDVLAYRQANDYIDVVNIESGHGNYMLHFSCCNVKVPYHFTIKEGIAIYQRLYDEYGKRAHAAKNNGSADWKALSHAARVTIEAKELLTDHRITLPLKDEDRKYVRAIKAGEIPHEEVTEFLDTGLAQIDSLRAVSSLSEKVDRDLYNEWIIRAYRGKKYER